jgi:hypothetical protein
MNFNWIVNLFGPVVVLVRLQACCELSDARRPRQAPDPGNKAVQKLRVVGREELLRAPRVEFQAWRGLKKDRPELAPEASCFREKPMRRAKCVICFGAFTAKRNPAGTVAAQCS